MSQHVVLSSFIIVHVLNLDSFVYRDDSLMSYMVIMRTEQLAKCFVSLFKLRASLGP